MLFSVVDVFILAIHGHEEDEQAVYEEENDTSIIVKLAFHIFCSQYISQCTVSVP